MLGSRRIAKKVCQKNFYSQNLATHPRVQLSTIVNRYILSASPAGIGQNNLVKGLRASFLNARNFSTGQLTPLDIESKDGPLFQIDRNVRNVAIIGKVYAAECRNNPMDSLTQWIFCSTR